MRRTSAILGLAVGLLASPAAATFLPQGPAAVLDAPSRCNASDPSLAALADGGFMAAWTDGSELSARRLDGAGRALAPELVVATGNPTAPELVGLPGGGYAAVWFDPQRAKVLARFADAAGDLGLESEVGAAGGGFGGLDAAAGPDGTLAVAWADGSAVYLRELRADGSGPGPAVAIESHSFLPEDPNKFLLTSPVLLVAPDRSLVVFWVQVWKSPDGELVGKRLLRDSTGSGYREVRRMSLGAYGPGAGYGQHLEGAIAADGSYVLAWAGLSFAVPNSTPPHPPLPVVFVQAFSAGDAPRNQSPLVIDGVEGRQPEAISLAALPGGGYVVAWESDPVLNLGGPIVLVQELGADGRPHAWEEPPAYPSQRPQRRPEVVSAADGLLLVAWEMEVDDVPGASSCAGEHIQLRPYRTACLAGACLGAARRFELTLEYSDPRRAVAGTGHGVRLTSDTAYFWFFAQDNVEVVAKVIDGRAVNGHFWFFWGGLTDLGLSLTLRDTITGDSKTYTSKPRTFVSAADTKAIGGGSRVSVQRLRTVELDRAAFAAGPPPPSATAAERPRFAPAPAAVAGGPGPCSPPELPVVPGPGLCLAGERFEVEATWSAGGRTGAAQGVELGDDSGYLWFFSPDNVELFVKALDGRKVNGRFWVFYGALTNVEYELTVRHAVDGTEWRHQNPPGSFGSGADVDALAPPTPVCLCPALFDPVCGRDGHVYGNSCEAYCVGWVPVDPTGFSCTD